MAASAAIAEPELANMHQFIENALELVLKGNAKSYNFLVQQISGGQDARVRRRIFLALPRCVSSVSREPHAFRQLLDALFKFDFLGDADEAADYAQFVVHLVSSNTVYVVPALRMLVRALTRPQTLPPALQAAAVAPVAPTAKIAVGGSFAADKAEDKTERAATQPVDVEERIRLRFERAHETLRRVLALAPTAANVLFPLVCEHFPHKRLDAPSQVAYLANVLRLSTYAPGLRERIFALVTDQLVAIDVEIKLDESEEDVFTMDDFLDDDLLPDATGANVDEMADKLDQMMLVMFEHIEASTRAETDDDTGGTDVHRAALIFKYLLKVFEHSILNTHRSKYPQFLLFYVCQMDPQFQDVFISQLLASSLDPQTPPVMRQSCGAYLASFLARAKYISVAYLQKALYHLLKWLHDQMDVYDALAAAGDAPTDLAAQEAALEAESEGDRSMPSHFHEGIYVSTLQTVCYLLCFRGLEIAQTESGYDFLRSLGWERLLLTASPGAGAGAALAYCPLAFCQSTVAAEFLNFVETLDLISDECIDGVDQAMSASAATASASTRGGRGKSMERSAAPSASGQQGPTLGLGQRQPLETFFPFDPYLLRRSFRFIGPLYLYWKHADPTSSENSEALATVKAIIRALHDGESDGESNGDDDGSGDDEEEEEEEEDVSMAGSAPAASFKNSSFMSSRPSSYMSVSSSIDGDYGGRRDEDEDDEEEEDDGEEGGELVLKPATRRKHKRVVPPRNTFDPSPALSASSPPSRLPPLGTTNAFDLGGFDDDDDDTGF